MEEIRQSSLPALFGQGRHSPEYTLEILQQVNLGKSAADGD